METIAQRNGRDNESAAALFRYRLQHLTRPSSALGYLNPNLDLRCNCTHTHWLVHVASIQDSRVHSEPVLDMQRFIFLFDQPIWLLCHICSTPLFLPLLRSRIRTLFPLIKNRSFVFLGHRFKCSLPVFPVFQIATSPHTHTQNLDLVLIGHPKPPSCTLSFLSIVTAFRSHPSQEYTVSRTRRWPMSIVPSPLSFGHSFRFWPTPSLWLHLVRLIGMPNPRISPALIGYKVFIRVLPSVSAFFGLYVSMRHEREPVSLYNCRLQSRFFVWNSLIYAEDGSK
jgi:hypothetical protein